MADADGAPVAQESYRLTIEPQGWQVEAHAALTLLEAAALAGVRLPSSCRNGTCRTCLCQASAGSVRYEIAWPGLSADEKTEGWILPCVAFPASDLRIAVPGAHRTT